MIIENADFELSVTIYSDEENDLVTLLREVAKEIKKGSRGGSVGGCLGTAYFQVKEPESRGRTLRAPAEASGADLQKELKDAGIEIVSVKPVYRKSPRSVR